MAILVGHKGASGTRGTIAPDLQRAEAAAEKATTVALPEDVLGVPAYRAWFENYASVMVPPSQRLDCAIENTVLAVQPADVAVRIFDPPSAEATIVFAHGGGWMMGSIETHDHICRWLAVATKSRVISVDYALAPEQPFPFAAIQTANVLRAVLAQRSLNKGLRVLVTGDSAGANIASLALLRLDAAHRQQIAGFISIYGAYAPGMDLSSHLLFADGPFGPSRQLMMWCWNLYAPQLQGPDRQQASPLGANIDHFPPTLCIAAECDLLIDDTLAFYSTLAKSGTDVSLSIWPGMTHGALHFVGAVDSVTSAAQSIVAFVESHRTSVHKDSTTGSLGRLLARAESEDRVQLPFLSDDAHLTPDSTPSIRTPHLLDRARLHGSLAHKLGAEIINGTYPPGSVLVADDDAGNAPGRSSYREAVRTLAAKGLVVATPKIGTKVAPRSSWRLLDPDVLAWHFESRLDESFLRDSFELRKVAEPSAAALTALRMTPQIKSGMATALAGMTGNAPATPGWHEGRLQFHELVLTGGGNELLGALWPSIQVILQWAINLRSADDHLATDDEVTTAYTNAFASIAAGNAEASMIAMAHLIDMNLVEALEILRRARPSRREAKRSTERV